MRPVLLILAVFIILPAAGTAAVINVPGDHPTIQQAIDAAAGGDTVLVAPGTYIENVRFKGKAITVKSSDGPYVTTIDGNHTKGLSVVSFIDEEGFGSVLEGFTITNGAGTAAKEYGVLGGGICCGWKDGASPIIRGNIIQGNEAECGGGIGLFGETSTPTIFDNIITGNTIDGTTQGYLSGFGAGIGGICSLVDISYNVIMDNTAVGGLYERSFGGGIGIFWADTAILWNNTIMDNAAATNRNFGGGIFCAAAHAYMVNNIVARNEATGNEGCGGGIYCDFEAVLHNNTISGNAAYRGGGVYLDGGAPEIRSTILFGNTATEGPEIWMGGKAAAVISHCDVQGGQGSIHMDPGCSLDWGSGMIDADPLFVDASTGDYHIQFMSPCRDAGDNATSPGSDFEDDIRLAPDMGADEFYTHLYHMGDVAPGGAVEVKLVGQPGLSPVGLCFGTVILLVPLPSMWGAWYLKFPIIGPIILAPIPADGVLVLQGVLPGTPAGPYSIPMQALIGSALSNPSVMEVN